MIEKWYYLTYFLIASTQVVLGLRNFSILIDAKRKKSYEFLATVLIVLINGIDMLFIGLLSGGLYRLPQQAITGHIFWFGFRNICTFGYWIGWFYLLMLTYKRCQND